MGWFTFTRTPAVNAASPELRRTELAKAIESARGMPTRANVRRAIRANTKAARMFTTAGETDRLTAEWPTNPVHIDLIISRYLRAWVARSREQALNNDTMKSFLRLNRLNIIGPDGIRFHSQAKKKNGKPDLSARRALESWMAKWGKAENCDIAGKLSWRASQGHACDTLGRDGEFFVRMVQGKDAGPMGFALQWIDPQRCPVEKDESGLPDGAFIRQGIEFNRYGRPVAYYFADDDGARGAAYSVNYTGRRLTRVPAEEVIHCFVQEFPGQKRGIPWAVSGLYRAKHVQAGEDAAVVNMRMGAAKMGFIEFKDGAGPEFDEDDDELTIDAEPGAFPLLPEGATLNKFDPLYPTGELVPFVKLMNRSFANGAGVSYHALTQDLTDVNFSSIRQGELDSRESYKDRQAVIIEQYCERVLSAALPRALLAEQVVDHGGKPLPAVRVDAYMECVWQPRRWSWIDPTADVDAAESWKNNLLASPSSLIREEGGDPHAVWSETAADIADMRSAGIPEEIIALSFGKKPTPPTDKPKEESKP